MAGPHRSTARSIRTRKGVIVGLAVSVAFGFSATASAGEQGMGGNCPMGSGGDGNASDATSPARSGGGVQPLRPAAPRPSAAPSQPAQSARPTSQLTTQRAAAPQATTVAAATTVQTPASVAVPASVRTVADAAAEARRERLVRQARRIAAARAAQARARASAEALRVRMAGADRWHAPAKGSALVAADVAEPVEAPAQVPAALWLGILGLAGIALALVLRGRRDPGDAVELEAEPLVIPPAADACAVEAELQEIIAEGRASRLLAEDETFAQR